MKASLHRAVGSDGVQRFRVAPAPVPAWAMRFARFTLTPLLEEPTATTSVSIFLAPLNRVWAAVAARVISLSAVWPQALFGSSMTERSFRLSVIRRM